MIDPKQYGSAAAELEAEAERHLAFAEKCRTAAAALRELAGEMPEKKAPTARRPAARSAPSKRATGVSARANEPKVRKILCACKCGETFEWEVKTGRAPQYKPGHRPGRARSAKPVAEPERPIPAPSPPTAQAKPEGGNGRAPAKEMPVPAAAPPGPTRRWNCPKHSMDCRTPTLCKSKYTTS